MLVGDFIKYVVRDLMGCKITGYGTVEHLVGEHLWLKEGGIIKQSEVDLVYDKKYFRVSEWTI